MKERSPGKASLGLPLQITIWSLVIVMLVALLYFDNSDIGEKEAGYLQNPVEGDLYVVNARKLGVTYGEGFEFVVLKADGISDDVVTFQISEFRYPDVSQIQSGIERGEIDLPGHYSGATVDLPRTRLAALREEGVILSVVRE